MCVVCEPHYVIEGKKLSVVGVSGELKVDAVFGSFIYRIGLVVKYDDRTPLFCALKYF